jgi:cell division protein ZapA (FtsZ GTPase activity inhibitor)
MTDDMMPVTLWLAGRSYRIRIRPEEEQAVRQASRLADEKINEMRTHYAGKDDQDFLAMVLLSYAIDSVEGATSDPVFRDELNSMERRIDKALQDS